MFKTLIFLLLISTSTFAQNAIPIKNWKSHSIPTIKDTLVGYNNGKVWWKVLVKNNKVYAYNDYSHYKKQIPFPILKTQSEKTLNITGNRVVMEVDDGYLVGIDYGEWGGDFLWYSKDGKVHKQLKGYRIMQFMIRDKKIYAIDGYGTMIKIDRIQNEWRTEPYIKFPFGQKPISIALDNQNNFIVITSDCLLKIDKEKKITKIIENGFWRPYLYPTSIIIEDNIVYAGMPMGIFKYNLDIKTKEWLMPK
ncbi:MAG: hypothetical protein WC622_08015 [Pedobacter sp.]|jgi:hypothetical protein|uniref:hypothetical protein n=1 Tax=Pedobacter sp. TaxID=1411316 RepID=UPI003566C70C